jgi:hypothetical protein
LVIVSFGLFVAWAADDDHVPALVLQGGSDHLYPIVAQGHGQIKWSREAFLFSDSPSQDFYTINAEGDVVAKTHFVPPSDARYFVEDFDRWKDGSIIIAMRPEADDVSPFLAFISPEGQTKHLIRTAPYYPRMLTIAQDGTLWTLGLEEIHRRIKDPELDPKDGILRQFDRGGTVMASALPQGDFLAKGETWRVSGKLSAVRDRLAWYSSMGTKSRYVEIPTDKIEQHFFPGAPDQGRDGSIDGFAVTDAGDATVTVDGAKGRRTFIFDRPQQKWVRLSVPAFPNDFGFEPSVVGSDGDSLVFSNRSSSAVYGLQR